MWSACRLSRYGYSTVRASSSPTTSRSRPARMSASIRASTAATRISLRRVISPSRCPFASMSAYGWPRHNERASRRTPDARSGSSIAAARAHSCSNRSGVHRRLAAVELIAVSLVHDDVADARAGGSKCTSAASPFRRGWRRHRRWRAAGVDRHRAAGGSDQDRQHPPLLATADRRCRPSDAHLERPQHLVLEVSNVAAHARRCRADRSPDRA